MQKNQKEVIGKDKGQKTNQILQSPFSTNTKAFSSTFRISAWKKLLKKGVPEHLNHWNFQDTDGYINNQI